MDESHGTGEERAQMEWRGRVQRVVDGESHQFNNWQDLLDLLALMLSETGEQPTNQAQEDTGH